METIANVKKYIFVIIAVMMCGGEVQARRRCIIHRTPVSHVTIVNRYAPGIKVVQRFNQKERWNMVVAYLKSHPCINAKIYANITGLSKKMAEAELDAFTIDKNRNLVVSGVGRKKMYMLQS